METRSGVKSSELWATAIPVLSTLLVGIAAIFGELAQRFPDVGWIALVAGVVIPISVYVSGRGKVKAAAELGAAAVAIEAARAAGFNLRTPEVETNPSVPVTPSFPMPRSGP